MIVFRSVLVAALLAAPLSSGIVSGWQTAPTYQERDFLTRVRRLTVEGRRAGGSGGQLFLAQWNHAKAMEALKNAPPRKPAKS
jgi:hypothetical protein